MCVYVKQDVHMQETVYSTLLGVDAGLPPSAHTEQVTVMTKYATPFIYRSHVTRDCSFTPRLIDRVNTITPHRRFTLLLESQSVLGNLGVDF